MAWTWQTEFTVKQSFNFKHVTLVLGIAVAIIVVFTLWMSHRAVEQPVLQSISTTVAWDETLRKTMTAVKEIVLKPLL